METKVSTITTTIAHTGSIDGTSNVDSAERHPSMSSIKKNSIIVPDATHLEVYDNSLQDNSINDIATSWFVWLVASTASTAGALFGYDTGIISAVLVYLGNDLDGRPTSSSEKELITSLCSGGAFVGAIITGPTADK